VRRRGADADVAADIRQRIVERLLVADAPAGRAAKIADYKGHGALRNWVASAAATTLSTARRSEGRQREHAAAAAEQAYLVCVDPEIQYMKERYGAMVHAAIVAAIDDSSPRDKTLLRLHLKERLSVDRARDHVRGQPRDRRALAGGRAARPASAHARAPSDPPVAQPGRRGEPARLG
jgi:RNA polymerase sigma-70 factor (ECF subfamily)